MKTHFSCIVKIKITYDMWTLQMPKFFQNLFDDSKDDIVFNLFNPHDYKIQMIIMH